MRQIENISLERMNNGAHFMYVSNVIERAAYHEFVRMVNALALVQGDADYADFMDYLNTEIVHYKREVIGQKASKPTTGGDTGKEEDGPESDRPDEI